ncbi:MAG TPA: hypothetical protein VLC09_07920 [Polyangiaceae bacterium]|nr:hypothetical protein [Polyangiaceae bacterium]
MTRQAVLMVATALMLACRHESAPSPSAKPAENAPAAGAPAAAVASGAPANSAPPGGPDVPGVAASDERILGPSAKGVSSEERERQLIELFSGKLTAQTLPVADRDVGASYNGRLYSNLTTERVERPVGEVAAHVAPAVIVSGSLERRHIDEIAENMPAIFRSCYRTSLEENELTPRRLHVELEYLVQTQGQVSRGLVVGKKNPDLWRLYGCLEGSTGWGAVTPPPSVATRLRFAIDLSHVPPTKRGASD